MQNYAGYIIFQLFSVHILTHSDSRSHLL